MVQDIALLRTQGYPIISTARGYLLDEPEDEKVLFLKTLDKIYWRSKEQRRAEFKDVSKLVETGESDMAEMDGETGE